jgi:hypothetical protein
MTYRTVRNILLFVIPFGLVPHPTKAAAIVCPEMPDKITQVNKDVVSDIKATVGSLGKLKAGEINTRTEIVTKNIVEKYAHGDQLFVIQMMSATYCSMLRESPQITDDQRQELWNKFQEKVFSIINPGSPQSSPPPPKAGRIGAPGKGLRAEIQNPTQDKRLIGPQPRTTSNKPVFCESLKLNLVLAPSAASIAPVLINSIVLDVEPITHLDWKGTCALDKLASRPHGIQEKNVFLFTLEDNEVVGRLIKDENTALSVGQDNLLQAGDTSRAITLKPNEEPVAFDVYIHSKSDTPRQLRFRINYDYNGAATAVTDSVIVTK